MLKKDRKCVSDVDADDFIFSNWALVIFVSRESLPVLEKTLLSALAAINGDTKIEILINGNPQLADDFANFLFLLKNIPQGIRIRLWNISFSDKANAWNQYISKIWSGEDVVFFLDGYVRLKPDAVLLLGKAVSENKNILAGTGVPSVGRTAAKFAERMKNEGGFHGNFCCIKSAALHEMKRRSIQLPVGLYRVDSLMGSFLTLGLDTVNGNWNLQRIFVHGDATWSNDVKQWWVWRNIQAKWRQKIRQARGVAENQAVRFFLRKEKILAEELPRTVELLIKNWIKADPVEAKKLFRKQPLTWYAVYKTLPKIPPEDEWNKPELICQIPSEHSPAAPVSPV